MKNRNIFISVVLIVILFSSCYKEEIFEGGEGLSDLSTSTHSSLATPDYSIVFNDDEVIRLDIVIDPVYWELMTDDLEDRFGAENHQPPPPPGQQQEEGEEEIIVESDNPIYVPCSVFHNDIEWYYVGIRFKGNSSLRDPIQQGLMKYPFRLEFDHFADDYPQITGQTFYGFQQLSLGNNFRDMSLVREKVASDLFRDFGINAAHTSFCRLYVDYGEGPVYFGLYTLVEIVFDTMLKDQFGSENGNCYKPENQGASFSFGSFNTSDFEKKTNEDLADWSDVDSLYTILHDERRFSNQTEWCNDLESILDVDYFLKWLAANTAMQNWDTYGRMTHNYYLYHDPADDLIKWIPWDNNEALQSDGGVNSTLELDLAEVGPDWPLIRFLMNQPDYRQVYKDYLIEFVNTSFEPSRMHGIYDHHYDLIKPYVTGSDGEIVNFTFLNSDSDFENAFTQLHSHVESRKTAVEDFVY
ncbi:MAG: spore coat protein [Marinilabiliales bacterium]|nr:MAG: spore coat protein [Marinilabiliales bacterium]